jgi:glycolate oxidase
MSLRMPEPDAAILGRRERIVAALRTIVHGEGVIAAERELRPYESDGLTAYRQLPMVVVLPETTEQVAQILRYCHGEGIKVVPRGAGTSLSGGALPLADGVLLGMAKFNRILEIDFENRVVVVEPGVTNLAVSNAVAHAGFYYAPDPSSQIACTIGGNVAENSGGVHCLKYGMTTNNVLGCEIVLITGEIIRVGGKSAETSGYDLMGIITGSEGLLGVITEVTVRLYGIPEAISAAVCAFPSISAAVDTVILTIQSGVPVARIELLDEAQIDAINKYSKLDHRVAPTLFFEFHGTPAGVDEQVENVKGIAAEHGGDDFRWATTPEARATTLLREWLSPQQRAQFDAEGYFDVVGCDTGKRYRIHHGTSMNVHEMDDAGHSKSGWCFVPSRRLAAGDVMLAQKIALETRENSVLAVANRFPPNQMTFPARRRRPY